MQINVATCLCLAVGSLFYHPPAWSGCHSQHPEEVSKFSLNLPASINVPSDTSPQTVIWSSDWVTGPSRELKCDPDETVLWHVDTMLQEDNTSLSGTYLSGSRNFDLRIIYRDHKTDVMPRALRGGWRTGKVNTNGMISVQPEYRVDLITKGHLTAGEQFIKGGVIGITADDFAVSMLTINASTLTVSSAGCNVLDDDILVSLGKHDAREISVSGATEYVPFSVRLDCDKKVRISYSLNGRVSGIASRGVLSLDHDDNSAQGIGVQIVDEENRPLIFNRQKLWKITNDEGTEAIHLKSRYIRTAREITPGQANATATLSFFYR